MATTQIGYNTENGHTISKTRGDGYTEYFDYQTGATGRKYDDGRIEVIPAPEGYKPPEQMPKYGKYKAPVKINTQSGAGVPGGFTGAPNKVPSVETAKYKSLLGKLGGLLSSISGLQGKVTGESASKLSAAKKKLMNSQSAAAKKAANIQKSAPDFTNPVSIPKLPEKPEIDLPEVDLPETPNIPNVESPSVPSTPLISTPKIGP